MFTYSYNKASAHPEPEKVRAAFAQYSSRNAARVSPRERPVLALGFALGLTRMLSRHVLCRSTLLRPSACQPFCRPPWRRTLSTASSSSSAPSSTSVVASTGSRADSTFRQHVAELVWPERWRLAGGFALLAGSSVISLVFPKAVGEAMDVCLSGDGYWTPARAAGALCALFTVQSVMIGLRSHTLTAAGESISASLRRRTFRSLLDQELAFFDVTRSGELLSRLSADTQALQKVATTHSVAAARGAIMVVGCVGMMCKISPALCAVGLAAFPAATLLSQFSGRRIKERQQLVQ
jgi:ABC-type bacteriocin/lantibiotic exporter with double-glycine peptidase domain